MNDAIEKLNAQQARVDKWSSVYSVAEQLKDICRHEPESAALIARDLDVKGMGIADAEKKIRELADQHAPKGRNGGVGISLFEAEKVLRKFFGLPERKDGAEAAQNADEDEVHFDLSALMGGQA